MLEWGPWRETDALPVPQGRWQLSNLFDYLGDFDKSPIEVQWTIEGDQVHLLSLYDPALSTRVEFFDIRNIDIPPWWRGELVDLIIEMIEPDMWDVFGGDSGWIDMPGDLILVRAPTRHLIEIETLLLQLAGEPDWPLTGETLGSLRNHEVRQSTITRVYDVGDLAIGGVDPDLRMQMIMEDGFESIDPDHWQSLGGELGKYFQLDDLVIVRTMYQNHVLIEKKLDDAMKQISRGVDPFDED